MKRAPYTEELHNYTADIAIYAICIHVIRCHIMFRLYMLCQVNNHMVIWLTPEEAINHIIILFIAHPYAFLLEHMHLTIHGVQRPQVINPLT